MSFAQILSNVERQAAVLRLLEQRRRVSVAELCETFAVSVATARRDLDALAEQGRLERVHGGAILARPSPPEGPVLERADEQEECKRRIGAAAAALVEAHDSVFIGSGTTSLEVARHLPAGLELTVVTNSLLVLNALAERLDLTLVSVGGILRQSEMSLIGHIAEQSLKELRFNKVVIGVRAVDVEEGLTNDYLPETMTDRVILGCGKHVIVVADHTKCARVSSGFLAPVERMNTLVTDGQAPAEFVAALQKRGVQVVLA
jgi:DeoR/GlpR family transcriptional regulator of sugar metabolism